MSSSIIEETTNEDLKVLPMIPQGILSKTRKAILTFYNQNQKCPNVAYIAQKIGLPKSKIPAILKELVSEKFLEKRGTRYYVIAADGSDYRSVSKLDKAKAALKLSPGMLILKGIILIIGCFAAYMSIYHSISFLQEFYTPTKAIISAGITVTFNIIAMDLIVFFYIKDYKYLSAFFGILFILGTIFSMSSTVIGLYNKTASDKIQSINSTYTQDSQLVENQLKYKLLIEQKEQALKSLDVARQELVEAGNNLNKVVNVESQLYKDLNWIKVLASRKVDTLTEDYTTATKDLQEYINNNTVTRLEVEKPENAYKWIGGVLKANPDTLQFLVSCYPALFYDIIAPIAFPIVLFTNGQKKKKVAKKKRSVKQK